MVPPLALQTPQVLIEEGDMSNAEIKSAIYSLTQVLATQVSKDTRVLVVPNSTNTGSRIRDFTRMDPPSFFGS